MKVKLAKTAGFCIGVKRAVELVFYAARESDRSLFTLGELIHNPQTVNLLYEKNIEAKEEIDNIPEGAEVLLRSHGIAPQRKEKLKEKCSNIWDATCPKVSKVQQLVKSYTEEGYQVIIIGDRDHAEVEALKGFSDYQAVVINSKEEVKALEDFDKVCVLGQTTLNKEHFEKITSLLTEKYDDIVVKNTICNTTTNRQSELKELSQESDAIVVVGGYNSANTKRLYEIAKATGKPSFWVEKASELSEGDFAGAEEVLVTAGASTPHWVISEIVEELETFNEPSLPFWKRRIVKNFGYTIIQSNLFKGGAAAALTLATFILFNVPIALGPLMLSFLYVLSMHTLHHFIDWQGLAIMDPRRLNFYRNSKIFLYALIILGVTGSLLISVSRNLIIFLAVCVALFGGAASTLKVFHKLFRKSPGDKFPFVKSKDVLNSIAIIWVAGIIPVLWIRASFSLLLIFNILLISSLAFIRSILFSLEEYETDAILQRASIPVLVGEKTTIRLVYILMAVNAAVNLTAIVAGIYSLAHLLLFIPLVYYLVYFRYSREGRIVKSTYAEIFIEGGLYVMGLIALIIGN